MPTKLPVRDQLLSLPVHQTRGDRLTVAAILMVCGLLILVVASVPPADNPEGTAIVTGALGS